MTTRTAASITGIPMGENGEDGLYFRVGAGVKGREVTLITVTDDLPGLHCNMERVRVFVGDDVIFEGPLHNLEGVHYEA